MIPQKLISLKDAMQRIRLGERFDLRVFSYDEKRKTGGDLVTYKSAIIVQQKNDPNAPKPDVGGNDITYGVAKKPNHGVHGTFNIQLKNGDVRKVHTVLMVEFNNKRIAL